jgi:mono/diheme cytochrome c family protein
MTDKHAAAAGIAALAMLLGLPTEPATADEAAGGEALFYTNCATCHVGSSALMGMRPPPDLLRDPLKVGDGAAALTAVIRSGAGGGRMPSFAGGLDDSETRALVAYIRSQRQR